MRTIKYLGKQDGRKEEIRAEGEKAKLRVEKERSGDKERVVKPCSCPSNIPLSRKSQFISMLHRYR